ncbi:MAG: XylR family transcriptional regulator [Phycisphaerae bacterium]|jgi:LacI family transcriptional regulator|nr:MAG: XylR family transcriptional regulator [Phycisphaerae bacterium]
MAGRLAKRKLLNVALLIETTRAYGREVLRGIGQYARVHGPWLFYLPDRPVIDSIPTLEEWNGDGIIVQPHQNERFVKELASCGKPVVSLSGPPGAGGLPTVIANQSAVVEQAITHFRERGFTRFAYCGSSSERIWPPTGELFRKAAESQGQPCELYLPGYNPELRTLRLAHIGSWLKSLRKPTALLAYNDLRAREVLDACQLVGVRVPEEIAVLGVSNDDLICDLSNPPLSSVIHNARRIGYEAAAMLERILRHEKGPTLVEVEPLGVKTRQSTDLLAIEDPEIATALRFIRENACSGIRVEDILEEVAMSRRALEIRFREAVGRAPHTEIRRVQLERVKELLATTDYKLERISEMAGFSTAQYLAGLFHRVTGMTPGEYRRRARSGASDPRGHIERITPPKVSRK